MYTYIVPKRPPDGRFENVHRGIIGHLHMFFLARQYIFYFKPGAFSCPEMILIYLRRNAFMDIPGCYTISTAVNKQSPFDYRLKIIRKGGVSFTFSVSRSSYCDADAGFYCPKRKMIRASYL